MLQSLNYFKYLNCPLNGTCSRPYCVFKHKQEIESPIIEDSPTLKTNAKTSKIKNEDENVSTTLEKVKNLINSCDSTIDPSVLKKQLDDLLGKTVKNEEKIIKSKKKPDNKLKNLPSYNPTPIDELNKRKKEKELQNLKDNDNDDDDDDDNEINLNNKRIIHSSQTILYKKSRIDEDEEDDKPKPSEEPEIKKLLQQKTESIIRKMNNPMSYIASGGASSSLKIDKLNLQQQLLKRYESVQKQSTNSSASTSKPTTTNKTPKPPTNQPKLIIDNTVKVPLAFRQRYLNFIYQESKNLFPNCEKACAKAAEQEKSIYDRAKTKNVYANLAAHLIKSLREQNQKSTTTAIPKRVETNKTNLKLVSQQQKPSYSHEAILAGPNASKVSYSINRKKKLTLKELNLNQLYNMFKVYILTEKQLEDNGYPFIYKKSDSLDLMAYLPKPISQQASIQNKYSIHKHMITTAKYNSSSEIKLCKRCTKTFTINKKFEYKAKDDCVHHWGKLRKVRVDKAVEQKYSCCSQDSKSEGCVIGKHVYDGEDYEIDKPLTGYVETKTKDDENINNQIYALDCEMCYTSKGLELTRVSVVDKDFKIVYERIVKPDYEILDYNTRWSGLTPSSFSSSNSRLVDVQKDLLKLFSKDTVLVGHSLESDLKALKLIHKNVVDTSVVFPHKMGPTIKRALRNLTCEILQKFIQEDIKGHDSKEDACACMELMLWKIEQDLDK